ncbi:uncharacterized protein LOC114744674 [Neltuma alba]|uniref:uncharacterized protein LOC114744674 n=1 Tax=Neltuma alba TaxID=207710 RepID=UPI0010A477A7|nr:uncharacterized protein LOC114744674 [Prosopis alba]
MAPIFDAIRSLNPSRQNWRIRVRVVRLWTMPGRYSHEELSSIEMLLRDEDGDNIHAQVKSPFITRHLNNFTEGKLCVISYFMVTPNYGSYRTTDHPYRMSFMYSTAVRPLPEDDRIHQFGFTFRSFAHILSNQFDDRYLTDVIGMLSAIGEKEECNINGQTQRRVNVELMDDGMEKLECTLWGDFADEILQFMAGDISSPVVVIIQLCKDGVCVVLADIVDFRTEKGWMYVSCKHCGKKVVPDGEGFFCEKCASIIKVVVPRYMVTCEVMDESGSCSVVIFDREFSRMVGCSAAEMRDRILKQFGDEGVGDGDGIPASILEPLTWKRYLFKLRVPEDYVKTYSNTCIAVRLTSDKDIIHSYQNLIAEKMSSQNLAMEADVQHKAVVGLPSKGAIGENADVSSKIEVNEQGPDVEADGEGNNKDDSLAVLRRRGKAKRKLTIED